LYLQKGEWNGQRIFDAAFVDLAWAPGPNNRYALHWWIGSAPEAGDIPYAVAVGFKGQRLYVFPTMRMVVALTASLPGAEERTVNGLVVGALVAASKQLAAPEQGGSGAALVAKQTKGFRGETRVFQDPYQDTPR
jgi:hypothetical protein